MSKSARAAFFPSIQLTGEGGYQSVALKMLFNPASAFYKIAAGLTQPIFDGFRLRGELELQKGGSRSCCRSIARRWSRLSATSSVALIAVQQSARRERLQREVVASARRAFELSETRLREGTIDLVTVLQHAADSVPGAGRAGAGAAAAPAGGREPVPGARRRLGADGCRSRAPEANERRCRPQIDGTIPPR